MSTSQERRKLPKLSDEQTLSLIEAVAGARKSLRSPDRSLIRDALSLSLEVGELVETYQRFAKLGLAGKMHSEIHAAQKKSAERLLDVILALREALTGLRALLRSDGAELRLGFSPLEHKLHLELGEKWVSLCALAGYQVVAASNNASGDVVTAALDYIVDASEGSGFDDRIGTLDAAIIGLKSLVEAPSDAPSGPGLIGPLYVYPLSEFSRREWFIGVLAKGIFEQHFKPASRSTAGPFQRFVNWIEKESGRKKNQLSSGQTIKHALDKSAAHVGNDAPDNMVRRERKRLGLGSD